MFWLTQFVEMMLTQITTSMSIFLQQSVLACIQQCLIPALHSLHLNNALLHNNAVWKVLFYEEFSICVSVCKRIFKCCWRKKYRFPVIFQIVFLSILFISHTTVVTRATFLLKYSKLSWKVFLESRDVFLEYFLWGIKQEWYLEILSGGNYCIFFM